MSEEKDIHMDRDSLDEARTNRFFKTKLDILNAEVTRKPFNNNAITPSSSTAPVSDVHSENQGHMDVNEKSHLDFFNGTFNEKVTAAITEAGGVVTLTVGQTGGGSLSARFVNGYGTLADNSTIALTVGASDAAPQLNFIYVLQSDPTALVKDTTDWPHTVDHIKVARILCPTAAFVAANGVYSFQLWNDENADDIFQGHMSHGTDRLRVMGAHWDSGVAGNGTQGYLTPTNNNTELISTAGVVYQLHRHVVPVFTTVDNDVVLVKNWNGDAYHDITNLYDIVADSGGNAIGATKWFKITIWGVANLTGSGFEPMIINLPSGFYNTQAACELDADGHGDVVIPTAFRGTGYLIASIVIQRAATWVIGSTKDLRGQTPSTVGGGGSRYTDAEADARIAAATLDDLSDVSLTGPQLEDVTSFLTANSAWYPCQLWGNNVQTNYQIQSTYIANNSGTAMALMFQLTIPTNKGGLKLYVKAVRIDVKDSDGNDFVNRVRVFRVDFNTQTAFSDVDFDVVHGTGVGQFEDSFAAVDVSAEDTVNVYVETNNNTSGELDITGVLLDCYYAT